MVKTMYINIFHSVMYTVYYASLQPYTSLAYGSDVNEAALYKGERGHILIFHSVAYGCILYASLQPYTSLAYGSDVNDRGRTV